MRILSLVLTVALLVGGAVLAAPVGAVQPPEDGLVVKLEPGVDPYAVAGQAGLTVIGPLIASRQIWLFDLAGADAKDTSHDVEDIDGVIYADAVEDGESPEAGGRQSGWNNGQSSDEGDDPVDYGSQFAATTLRLAEAHQRATGAGVVVAIIDSGLDPAAIPGLQVRQGWDLVDDDANTADEADGIDNDRDGLIDESAGHGTHVAGIVHLVAPGAVVLPYRVLDSDGDGNVYAAAEAIEMAVQAGARVINISFGSVHKSKLLERAIKAASAAGVLVIAAAGNTGTEAKSYPAAFGDVIATAALNPGSQLAGFSNRGGWVDIAAPGEDIISLLPGGGYARWSGTSMAAPFVAGEAALLLELRPTLRRSDLWKAIKDGARHLDGPGAKGSGEGLIDILASFGRLPR